MEERGIDDLYFFGQTQLLHPISQVYGRKEKSPIYWYLFLSDTTCPSWPWGTWPGAQLDDCWSQGEEIFTNSQAEWGALCLCSLVLVAFSFYLVAHWCQGDATYSLDGTALGIFPIYGDGPMYLEVVKQARQHSMAFEQAYYLLALWCHPSC